MPVRVAWGRRRSREIHEEIFILYTLNILAVGALPLLAPHLTTCLFSFSQVHNCQTFFSPNFSSSTLLLNASPTWNCPVLSLAGLILATDRKCVEGVNWWLKVPLSRTLNVNLLSPWTLRDPALWYVPRRNAFLGVCQGEYAPTEKPIPFGKLSNNVIWMWSFWHYALQCIVLLDSPLPHPTVSARK